MEAADKIKISFDDEYKIRVLDPLKFKKTEELEKETAGFVEKISSFNEKIASLVEVLESNATRIDNQKLKAIGMRMTVENESYNRSRQKSALEIILKEKRAELDRYNAQYQSLERIEAEQRAIIEKLTSSSS